MEVFLFTLRIKPLSPSYETLRTAGHRFLNPEHLLTCQAHRAAPLMLLLPGTTSAQIYDLPPVLGLDVSLVFLLPTY